MKTQTNLAYMITSRGTILTIDDLNLDATASYERGLDITHVVAVDGFKSYAKAWTVWDENEQRHIFVRVGQGSYGDNTVWQNPNYSCGGYRLK